MAIYRNDILVTKLVDSALPTEEVIQVKNQTLDGTWHIQTIGDSARKVSVTAHLKLIEKDSLEEAFSRGEVIKVIFDGKTHVGVIESKPDIERLKFSNYPLFKMRFNLLVTGGGS